MLRKLFIVAGVVLIGGWLYARSDFGSYAKTAIREIASCAKGQVPLSFEIKRARDMLAQLDRADDRLISVMANEMVAIKHLERDTENLQASLEKDKEVIQAATEKVKSNNVLTADKGSAARGAQVVDLERRFRVYRQKETTLKNQRELLAEHQQRLEAVKEQREGLKGQKAELQARIQKLETEVEILKAAESRSRKWVGDSEIRELARLKELVDSLEQRIETSMTELSLRQEIKPAQVVPMKLSSPNLVHEIEVHFGKSEVAGQ